MPPKKPDLSGYQYSALSSQVTQADRRLIDRTHNEPTGEAQTLRGRINPKEMGSRVQREQIKDLDKKKAKAKADDEAKQRSSSKRTPAGGIQGNYADVLQATADLEGLRYTPRTAETREIYELILNVVHTALGDQTSDIIRSAADTVLETLKTDHLQDFDKKKDIDDVICSISS